MRPRVLLGLCLLTLFVAGCQKRGGDLHSRLRSHLQAPDRPPVVLAVYMPWFGDPDHIDVGYSSVDRVVLQRQVEQAQSLGINGFLVDWYGTKKPTMDRSYALLQQVAAQKGFTTAIMYGETVSDPARMTEDAITQLRYAYDRYIRPGAPGSQAYLRHQGRPVIFIWPRGGHTDWAAVKREVESWPERPLLIYKHEPTSHEKVFDGFYVWINPGRPGWQPDGSNWGEEYLDQVYRRMLKKHPDKLLVGTAWPGFDDSRASWSENRYMHSRCGKVLENTLKAFQRFYDEHPSSPFLLLATWNDYEEGTAIEQGIARQDVAVRPRERGCEPERRTNAD